MYTIQITRIYDQKAEHDSYRILIDRLWPRGIKKEDANIDKWLKEVAPSNDLRKWFGHEPTKFHEFEERYIEQLAGDQLKRYAVDWLLHLNHSSHLTLVYAAKDPIHNHAHILRDYLITRR